MLHGCVVGNRVLIGMGSIILDGATIGDDVMIGAGTLIPPHKTLMSGYLYMGSPVRQIRRLTEEELINLKHSAQNYTTWKQDYLDSQ